MKGEVHRGRRPFVQVLLFSLHPSAFILEFLLQVVRQGQIEIIAAENQVVADGHAVELHLAAWAPCRCRARTRINVKSDVPPPISQTSIF